MRTYGVAVSVPERYYAWIIANTIVFQRGGVYMLPNWSELKSKECHSIQRSSRQVGEGTSISCCRFRDMDNTHLQKPLVVGDAHWVLNTARVPRVFSLTN